MIALLAVFAAPALAAEPPGVETAPATAATDDSATLNGTVNPEGTELEECRFAYGPGSSLSSSVPCAETSAQIGSGSAPVAVHADLTGLAAGTQYSFRLVGKNEFGTNQGSVETFKTHGPTVEAESAAGVTSTAATLQATVNPNGEPTTFHFEYVDDVSFQANGFAGAASVPVPDGPVGTGLVGEAVSAEISGLQASTVYHFRVVANSPDGTATGSDSTFTTYPTSGPFPACPNDSLRYGYGALLPDCRAYEQATPINKNGTNALAAFFVVQAGTNGGGITFWSPAGMPGGRGSAQLTTYVALRSATGWSTTGMLPPAALGQNASVLGWTPDVTKTINLATKIGEGSALFEEDNASGAVSMIAPYHTGVSYYYTGASSDGSKVFFEERGTALTPEADGTKNNLYAWDSATGDISLVGVLPSSGCGSPPCIPPGGSFAGTYNWWNNEPESGGSAQRFYTQAVHAISVDGSKAYFTAGETGQIYLRENPTSPAATTVQVSASQKTNGAGAGGVDPNGPQPAAFMAATPDGSKAFFLSPEELTNNATTGPSDNGRDLYRYDAASGQLTDLAPDASDPNGAEVEGVVGTSDDGSRVYFVANGDLDGSGPAGSGNCHVSYESWSGECSLYLWNEGAITFIARLDASGEPAGNHSDAQNWAPRGKQTAGNAEVLNTGRVSADGGAVLFRSRRKLTSYDNHGVPELYRYDASSGSLDCVSCNPSGVAPVGQPELQVQTSFLGLAGPAAITTRNLSDSGNQVFFQTPDGLLPADTNGLADVYEWEADGAGTCQSSFEDGGCLYLISTGKSNSPSNIADASASGDEAFFFTEQQLVGQDEDELIDVYDAHVGGGLASQNPQRAPECSGEACKGPSTQAPGAKGAGSAVFQGPDNAAGQVSCVAEATIKRLTKSAKSLRSKARKLSRRAAASHDPAQARQLRTRAHRLGKSARAREKRAHKLTKRCRGVGRKGTR